MNFENLTLYLKQLQSPVQVNNMFVAFALFMTVRHTTRISTHYWCHQCSLIIQQIILYLWMIRSQ